MKGAFDFDMAADGLCDEDMIGTAVAQQPPTRGGNFNGAPARRAAAAKKRREEDMIGHIFF